MNFLDQCETVSSYKNLRHEPAPLIQIGNKHSLADLAHFGGKPLFQSIKPIGQLAQPDREAFFRYTKLMFEKRRCTNNGPLVQELETRLASMHNTIHCISFTNASLALIAVMRILSPEPGEVIMPAFTYAGLPHLAQWAGHVPRFCDIEPETHTLDPKNVIKEINGKTALILGVHQVNSPCAINELQEISDMHGVPLIFDSVHGIGCTFEGLPIGRFGRAEVFSLHATKIINGFEGGYITTNDDVLAAELRVIRNFGFTGRDTITALGMNAKMNEIHAAMSLSVLDDFDNIIHRNKQRYDAYRRYFKDIEEVSIFPYEGTEKYNYEHCILHVNDSMTISRDQLVGILRKENTMVRPYYSPPLHLSEHCPGFVKPPKLPVTESMSKKLIQMPVGEFVNIEDIEKIALLFKFICANKHYIADSFERN